MYIPKDSEEVTGLDAFLKSTEDFTHRDLWEAAIQWLLEIQPPAAESGMRWVKYKKSRPIKDGEYLTRYWEQPQHAVRGSQYLDFREGAFQVEHDEYYNLEWLDESTPPSPVWATDGDMIKAIKFGSYRNGLTTREWLSSYKASKHIK